MNYRERKPRWDDEETVACEIDRQVRSYQVEAFLRNEISALWDPFIDVLPIQPAYYQRIFAIPEFILSTRLPHFTV